MGGSGAKNRRRRKREEEDEGGGRGGNNTAKSYDMTNKKKKFKKPKHLQRKLDLVSNENDRKEILYQMKTLQEAKKDYNNTKQQKQHEPSLVTIQKQLQSLKNVNTDKTMNNTKSKVKDHIEQKKSDSDMKNKKSNKNTIKKNDEDDDDDDDDDDDESTEDHERSETNINDKRQRGKRRRGRKDTSKQITENEEKMKEEQNQIQHNKEKQIEIDKKPNDDDNDNDADNNNNDTHDDDDDNNNNNENGNNNKQKRYCIGRKPVTDYEIGKIYTGKVVYIKSFGVFFDIGCHSDAFCHVSRLDDNYIDDPNTKFHVGDMIKNQIRVVEIDKNKKRITVSLQSIARIDDENKSLQARMKRQNLRHGGNSHSTSKSNKHTSTDQQQESNINNNTNNKRIKLSSPSQHQNLNTNQSKSSSSYRDLNNKGNNEKDIINQNSIQEKAESEMTPAELKRARKLARRAERRATATAGAKQQQDEITAKQ